MKIAPYMVEKNITPDEMAALVGSVSASGVVKWMRGERVPRPDQLRRIAEATCGAVLPNDFILEPAKPEPDRVAS